MRIYFFNQHVRLSSSICILNINTKQHLLRRVLSVYVTRQNHPIRRGRSTNIHSSADNAIGIEIRIYTQSIYHMTMKSYWQETVTKMMRQIKSCVDQSRSLICDKVLTLWGGTWNDVFLVQYPLRRVAPPSCGHPSQATSQSVTQNFISSHRSGCCNEAIHPSQTHPSVDVSGWQVILQVMVSLKNATVVDA